MSDQNTSTPSNAQPGPEGQALTTQPPAYDPSQTQGHLQPYGQTQPYGQAPQGWQPTPVVAPRNPALALIASFFIIGLGQLLNGQVGKGVLMFGLAALSGILMFVLIGFLTLPAVWVWSMVDAYSSAKKWNAAHGIIS